MKNYEIERKLKQLKNRLVETDYHAIKFAEGVITLTEYNEIRNQRIKWREEINQLENQLKGM